ncbi:hypothetical protein Ddye_013525 [Dipteronia dyeriana]|uniref:Uncharacterized protein n=1 Tax=Dipteronia dyeriana TaxID=168575 RepID=A0AAD9X6J2_9ROSI|nr:hypothetical protein Ddye_013525 [Dipteronia dyeriana]
MLILKEIIEALQRGLSLENVGSVRLDMLWLDMELKVLQVLCVLSTQFQFFSLCNLSPGTGINEKLDQIPYDNSQLKDYLPAHPSVKKRAQLMAQAKVMEEALAIYRNKIRTSLRSGGDLKIQDRRVLEQGRNLAEAAELFSQELEGAQTVRTAVSGICRSSKVSNRSFSKMQRKPTIFALEPYRQVKRDGGGQVKQEADEQNPSAYFQI